MTREEVLDALRWMSTELELRWMRDLGYQLTVLARAGYPVEGRPGSIQHLMAFNEMQHQVYGRIRHLERGDIWTLETFLDGLFARAQNYRVEEDFNLALKKSLCKIPLDESPSQIQ